MSKKLFVGNLSFSATDSELQSWVEQRGHATEEVRIMTDRDTGKPRGFGFITLSATADARQAIEDMNGQEFMGRPLTVNEAKPKEPRGGGGFEPRGKREPRW
jgi:RNA recognition motif-containing protein